MLEDLKIQRHVCMWFSVVRKQGCVCVRIICIASHTALTPVIECVLVLCMSAARVSAVQACCNAESVATVLLRVCSDSARITVFCRSWS